MYFNPSSKTSNPKEMVRRESGKSLTMPTGLRIIKGGKKCVLRETALPIKEILGLRFCLFSTWKRLILRQDVDKTLIPHQS